MKKALVTILILGVLGTGGYGVYHHFFEDAAGESGRVSSTSDDAVYVDLISEITGFGSGTGLHDRYGGEVEPQATLEVKLESERTVAECFVKEGDEVKEGQKLFVYNTQEDEDRLAQAEIEIERCKSDIEISKEEIAQYEKESKKADKEDQLMYTTQILTAQNAIKRSEYEIKTQQLEMERLKESIGNAVVYAEMGGIVQKISDPNQSNYSYSYNDSGESAYITILAQGDYRIKGSVNEQNLPQIYAGMSVIVYSRVDENQTWNGTISEVKTDNAAEEEENMYSYYGNDSGSSSYAFYVELDGSEGLILGQHVYMEENVGQNNQKDGLWLEEYYIMQEGEEAYVWLADSSNVLKKHAVVLGEYDPELMKYEVTDGLAADDYIAYPSGTTEEGVPVIYNDYSVPAMPGAGVEVIDDLPYEDYDDYTMPEYSFDSGVDGSVSDMMGIGMDFFDADEGMFYDASGEAVGEETFYDADAAEFDRAAEAAAADMLGAAADMAIFEAE